MPEANKPEIQSGSHCLFSADHASFCQGVWQQKCLQFSFAEQAGNAAPADAV